MDLQRIRQLLEPMADDKNAFLFLLIARRKWLINSGFDEQEARKLFPSSEMLIHKEKVNGNLFSLENKLLLLKLILVNDLKFQVKKDNKVHNVFELYQQYPTMFSLLVTLQPRDLKQAIASLVQDTIKVAFNNDEDQLVSTGRKFNYIFFRHLQKTQDKRHPLFLIDFDQVLTIEHIRQIKEIVKNNTILRDNIIYAVTTPSKGLHLVFKLNKDSSKFLFTKTADLFNDFVIEYSSMSNKLTHVPGINPHVKDITEDFLC